MAATDSPPLQQSNGKNIDDKNAAINSFKSLKNTRGFLTSFATISVTCIRIICILPREWFLGAEGSAPSSTAGGVIGWFLRNSDLAPIWTSILIRPFETWEHVREAKAARVLFGSGEFRDVYMGSYIHLPPLVLATLEPVVDNISEPWQSFLVGVLTHLVDLWIATKFIQIGNYVLQELQDPWEDKLQPRIPESLRASWGHIFALSDDGDILYTEELPAIKVEETESNGAENGHSHEKGTGDGNGNEAKPASFSVITTKDTALTTPDFTFTDLPLLAAQLYYYSPFTALASGLGTTHRCFQNIWLLLLMQSLQQGCQRTASVSLTAFWLALGTYVELHYVAFLIPISLWLQRRQRQCQGPTARNKVILLCSFFGFYFACLQGLSLLLVGSSQFGAVLWSSYGHGMSWKHLHPNFSVLWYLNMEIFERFRIYFSVIIGGLPYLLLAPLTTRLHRYPMVMATIIWMLWTMFRPTSTLVDANVALCFMMLCPRSLVRMRTGTTLVPAFAVSVPITLYLVTLWLWLETGSGEANFTFFQCLAYGGFLATFFLEFCGASVRRDKVLRFTEKLLQKKAKDSQKKD